MANIYILERQLEQAMLSIVAATCRIIEEHTSINCDNLLELMGEDVVPGQNQKILDICTGSGLVCKFQNDYVWVSYQAEL